MKRDCGAKFGHLLRKSPLFVGVGVVAAVGVVVASCAAYGYHNDWLHDVVILLLKTMPQLRAD